MKHRQHMVVTRAVLDYYGLPPEYVVYSIWPDFVPRQRLFEFNVDGVDFSIAVREPHHDLRKKSIVEEFLMNVSDYRRGAPEDRVGALANTVKLLHYVQDGCVFHDREDRAAAVPVEKRWLAEGEGIAARLSGGARERAEALAWEVYPRVDGRGAVRAAVSLSSAFMKAFLDSAGWRPRTGPSARSR